MNNYIFIVIKTEICNLNGKNLILLKGETEKNGAMKLLAVCFSSTTKSHFTSLTQRLDIHTFFCSV